MAIFRRSSAGPVDSDSISLLNEMPVTKTQTVQSQCAMRRLHPDVHWIDFMLAWSILLPGGEPGL